MAADLQKKNSAFSRAGDWVRPIILGALSGAAAGSLLILGAALLYGALHAAGETIPAAAAAAAAVSGFAAGLTAAKMHGRHGLLTGGCSALLLAGILLLTGWAVSGVPGMSALTRAAVLTAAGMTGGVIGVNGKSRKS